MQLEDGIGDTTDTDRMKLKQSFLIPIPKLEADPSHTARFNLPFLSNKLKPLNR